LLPQLLEVLRAKTPQVMFVKRESHSKYTVSTQALAADVDGGEGSIQAFQARRERGEVTLSSVFQRLDNDQLAAIPALAQMLSLKGIRR
jgi:hypothetical protein